MNCERCQIELEDFLYGELADDQAAAVRAHLSGCAACAQARAELEQENEIFAQYYEQTALEPAPEVWAAIRARIQTEAPAPLHEAAPAVEKAAWFSQVFAWFAHSVLLRQVAFGAALIIISVAATTLYFKTQQPAGGEIAVVAPSPTPSPTATAPAATPPPVVTPAANDLAQHTAPAKNAARPLPKAQPQVSETQLIKNQIARAEREYQNAIKLLDRVIARHRDQFAPGLLKQYESSLALIDASIAESRRALHERPDDAASGQFLLAAYAKKLELMQEIATQAGQ